MKNKTNKGITLIALVITIIVLLILAGISIATLTGENGILTQAGKAKEVTDKAQEREGVSLAVTTSQIKNNGYEELNQTNLQNAIDSQFGTGKATVTDNGDGTFTVSFVDSKRDYNITSNGVEIGIDWNEIFANAQAPTGQIKSDVIGIGTNGQVVNMDLWEYTKLDDGTYGLNDSSSLAESGTRTAGYDINYLKDGKIQGTIPQYIKRDTDKEFMPVTNINYLFYNTDLSEPPVIPYTVISMRATFNSCKKLTKMPVIPSNVTNMYGTFASCSNLTEISSIPESVSTMYGTFNGCTNLSIAPIIPNNVVDMSLTFQNCSALTTVSTIPNSVTNMWSTFNGCTSLTTAPSISNSVTNMWTTFQNCTSLTTAPIIPNSVTNMYATFSGCTSLTTAPSIPNSVTVLCTTFKNCSNLQGTLEINANVNGKELGSELYNNIDYNNCLLGATTNNGISLKVTGNCTILDKIVANANNPQITL